MGVKDLSRYHSLYIDTSVYIYFFEDHPKFGRVAESILSQVVEKNISVFASELLFSELLVLPYKKNDMALINLYENLPIHIPSLQTESITRKIAQLAARLRAEYAIRTPDALHIATAIENRAELFVCTDRKLSHIQEIEVWVVGSES